MRAVTLVGSGVLAVLGVVTLIDVREVAATARRMDAERQEMEHAAATAPALPRVASALDEDSGMRVRTVAHASRASGAARAARGARGTHPAHGRTSAVTHHAAPGGAGWAPDVEVLPPIVIVAPARR